MNRKDGLSRTERLKENSSLKPFAVVDSDRASLLRQSLDIANFIRFYNDRNEPDGNFGQLLEVIRDLKNLYENGRSYDPDKKMEPSQALLFTFIENLHNTGRLFNERWHHFTRWYLENFLRIKPLPIEADKVWLEFKKNVPEPVLVEKGVRFSVKDNNNEPVYYKLKENLVVNDIKVKNIYSLYFEKDRNRVPAAGLGFVTTVKIKDLLEKPGIDGEMMFGRNQDATLSRAPGIIISSPALLLREGKRGVQVTLVSEDTKWLRKLDSVVLHLKKHYSELAVKPKEEYDNYRLLSERYFELGKHHKQQKLHFLRIAQSLKVKADECELLLKQHHDKINHEESLMREVLKNIFYLSVSTPEGWTEIPAYTARTARKERSAAAENKEHSLEHRNLFPDFPLPVDRKTGVSEVKDKLSKETPNSLLLNFTLPEDFLPTCAAEQELHSFSSEFPALKILLNFDAWLYPFSWLKDFLLCQVKISTSVKGIGNLQVYNELGRIDNSRPFIPFGINTSKGTWMAVGNYEMSIKHTQSVDLKVQWNQLPDNAFGMYGHYSGYHKGITNRSFKVRTSYLTDYNWYDTPSNPQYYLFNSQPEFDVDIPYKDKPLADKSDFRTITVKGMAPVRAVEDQYEYTLSSRSGFVRLTLTEPSMGFGEEDYRRIFTEQMMENARKKKKYPTINPPVSPMIEKITLSYKSEDHIDLRSPHHANGSGVYQVSPFRRVSSRDKTSNKSIPFAFSMDSNANLLVALENVRGGETFSMYLDFSVVSNEFFGDALPSIHLYWGNGTYWENVPEGAVISDETDKMLVSGCMVIHFPEHIPPSLLDSDGLLWIRAGISKNEQLIPQLAGLYTNVGKIVLSIEHADDEDKWEYFKTLNGELVPEKNLPGIASFKRITNFYAGREKESIRDMQMRVSEFVTHRERAVTPRDFERITLQKFPDLGKVKCLPGFRPPEGDGKCVTIAVIPHPFPDDKDYCKPVVTSGLIAKIEDYLEKRCTSYISEVNVINPVYEELMVKCIITMKKEYHLSLFGTIVKNILDELIAPWQKIPVVPSFGQNISLNAVYDALTALEFTDKVEYLSIIQVSEDKQTLDYDNRYKLHVYEKGRKNELIIPHQPHAIFVPSDEHIIELVSNDKSSVPETFGIGEMKVGKTFIIGK